IAYLALTTLVLIRNWFTLEGLNSLSNNEEEIGFPLVSICIPARNEEDVIDRCVTSALKQDYPNFEVLILNDNSTDRTTQILDKFSGIIANLHHLNGKPKPDDWLGKPWACHQLSLQAKGKYLVFIDADVWLEESAVSKTVLALTQKDAITVWPKQHFGSFWEALIIPLVYHVLYTLLPAKFVERDPDFIPRYLQKKFSLEFAAACGQFLAFNKEAYHKINGHRSVKNEIVEDVKLAKILKGRNLGLKMYHGVGTVHCRMYQNHNELWQGFRKNFFAGFSYNIPKFIAAAILHIMVFILPFIIAGVSLFGDADFFKLSLIPIILIFFQRLLLDIRFGWNPLFSLLHPVAVLWFQGLAIRSVSDYLSGKKAMWKGREV
ncbi:MAG: glycosyltransferase, partial [Balneolaceae bacterium]